MSVNLKVNEIKEKLKSLGAKPTGNKRELLKRFVPKNDFL